MCHECLLAPLVGRMVEVMKTVCFRRSVRLKMGPSTGRRRCYDLPPTSYTGVPREWNATHCRPGTLPETSRPVVVGGDGGLVFSGIHDPVEGGLHRYEVRRHTFWRDFTPRVVLPFRKGLRHPVSRPSFPSEPRPVWSGYFLFVPEQALV